MSNYNNQFTFDEARQNALKPENISDSATLYMQGEAWGTETVIGTMEDWKSVIPENESEAKMTGYHDWYRDEINGRDADDEIISWDDYRAELLGQLRKIEIIETD